jgi:hypothetical protein
VAQLHYVILLPPTDRSAWNVSVLEVTTRSLICQPPDACMSSSPTADVENPASDHRAAYLIQLSVAELIARRLVRAWMFRYSACLIKRLYLRSRSRNRGFLSSGRAATSLADFVSQVPEQHERRAQHVEAVQCPDRSDSGMLNT